MRFDGFLILLTIHVITMIGVVIALIMSIKLYRETDRGWYWGSLVLSALFFAVSQWLFILTPFVRSPFDFGIMHEISEILGTAFLAVFCYGLYTDMHTIRKRVE